MGALERGVRWNIRRMKTLAKTNPPHTLAFKNLQQMLPWLGNGKNYFGGSVCMGHGFGSQILSLVWLQTGNIWEPFGLEYVPDRCS